MTRKIYQVADFILDAKIRQLYHRGKAVSISSKAFDIFEYLVENPGRIVKKAELLENVWSDSFVEESNLPVHVSALRRVLGEKRGESRFIKTIPGRGYSFIASVQELNSVSESSAHFPQTALYQDKSPEPLAIAVLPFTFDLTNSDFEYLANGITQSLIDDLSQSATIKVLAHSAVRSYRHSQLDLQEIGFLLGANRILTGHISEYKNELEINVELLNANDKSHLWGIQQTFNLKDIFRVKKEISFALAEKLKLKLTESDRNDIARQQELNLEAHKLYFRGKFVLDARFRKVDIEGSLLQALSLFQQAIKKDSNYSLAYTGIGSVYISLHNHHLRQRDEAYAETKKALDIALKTDSRLSQGYALKGLTEIMFERKYAEAEKSLDKAIKLNPNNAEAYHWKSHVVLMSGKFDDALAISTKALQFDPASVFFGEHLIRISYFAGDYDKTIFQAEALIEFEETSIAAHLFLALARAELGIFKQSLENIERTIIFRCTAETLLAKAYILALMNSKDQAEKLIANVLNKFFEMEIDPADLSYTYSALGKIEKAFEMLEKAYQVGSTSLCFLKVEKRCENLRKDARFNLFLDKLNLS